MPRFAHRPSPRADARSRRGKSALRPGLTPRRRLGRSGLRVLIEALFQIRRPLVVFGLPRGAIARGGTVHVGPLWKTPTVIDESFERLSRPAA